MGKPQAEKRDTRRVNATWWVVRTYEEIYSISDMKPVKEATNSYRQHRYSYNQAHLTAFTFHAMFPHLKMAPGDPPQEITITMKKVGKKK